MKQINIILFLVLIPFLGSCQNEKAEKSVALVSQIKKEQKFRNKVFKQEEWESLLKQFPTRDRQFLLNMNQVSLLKDTISRKLLNEYFTNDTISVKQGNKDNIYKFFYPLTKIKGYDIIYPIGSLPPIINDPSFGCSYKSEKNGLYPFRVYPIGKINWSDSLTMVLWGYPQPYDEFYFVTAYILNQNYEKVGHFGFMYSDTWRKCDNTIDEIMKDSEPLSFPKLLKENGFLLHDKMVGSYYEDELQEQFLEVEITPKGQFEAVKMTKIYENEKIRLWSKKGYYIQDKDGFSNLREQPNNKSKIVAKLPNGTALEILDSSKEWWEVKCLIDKKGFIHKSRIIEGGQ